MFSLVKKLEKNFFYGNLSELLETHNPDRLISISTVGTFNWSYPSGVQSPSQYPQIKNSQL